ncbi:MAG: hypothetical protein HYX48_07455 [Chlamydiales bacterium]|nr:hypothetical protein [Chlamydiales bacterium]
MSLQPITAGTSLTQTVMEKFGRIDKDGDVIMSESSTASSTGSSAISAQQGTDASYETKSGGAGAGAGAASTAASRVLSTPSASGSAAGAGAGASTSITEKDFVTVMEKLRRNTAQIPLNTKAIVALVAKELGRPTQDVLTFMESKQHQGYSKLEERLPPGITADAFIKASQEAAQEIEAAGHLALSEDKIVASLAQKLNVTVEYAMQVLLMVGKD